MARRLIETITQSCLANVTTISRSASCKPGVVLCPQKHAYGSADFMGALKGQDLVIHTAARAHILNEVADDPLLEYRKVNVDYTLNLARQAVASGVKRFIHISSIGVNGTTSKTPFTPASQPNPEEDYALSKYEAEQGLIDICEASSMELVIIRPPLVYGPGAPGNFLRMVKWVEKGVPLPLGAISNKRSLVGIDNLVDLIITCTYHPAAAGKVLMASDGEDVSTPELLRKVAKAMGKPSRLIYVPAWLLKLSAKSVGRSYMAKRLLSSLQVDITQTEELLGWKPPHSLDESLRRCFHDSTT